MLRTVALLVVLVLSAAAQTSSAPASIQASGSNTINGIQPDQVQLTVGVVTTTSTAQAAASQNATQASAAIAALKNALGTNGTVQTISYSLTPQYGTGKTPPSIVGYTARNTVQVTTGNLNLIGPLIDAANQAGANNINGPSYSLQNSEPYTQQALAAAAKQALAHASAIAAGLGAKTGAIISAREGNEITPIGPRMFSMAASATPIQNETVSVSATVTVTVALVP